MRFITLPTTILSTVLGLATLVSGQTTDLNKLQTAAEKSDYTSTATAEEVNQFLTELVAQWPAAELTTIGQTVEGRELSAVLVPAQDQGDSRPLTVLILGGIHSGECDGKEGLLALARDMAAGKLGPSLGKLNLILVPNYNADGNERRSPGHRPGQAGPTEGMGIRENAQGLDLNRDFVKLESPEARSLISAIDEHDVDVLIDLHTTNGSLHRYDLTYDIPHNPIMPSAVDQWLRSELVPEVTSSMKAAGFSTYYYGNFDRDHTTWKTYGHEPRYSTDYMALRGKIGILSESYSYVSYQRRVEASYQFAYEVIKFLASNPEKTRQAVAAGSGPAKPGDPLPLRAEIAKTAENELALGFVTAEGKLPTGPYGHEALKKHEPKDYLVELWNSFTSTESVDLPYAYAIAPQFAWVAQRLALHGVRVQTLEEAADLDVEQYRVTGTERSREFQGHRMLTVETELLETNQQMFQPGTFIVRVSQPLGKLAAYLLEPRSDDSLAVWNFFDPDIIGNKLYPVARIMQPVAHLSYRAASDEVPASESITLQHLSQPSFTVDYDGDLRRSAHWLGDTKQYVVRSSNEHFVVDAETGAQRRLDELTALAAALEQLDEFSASEARSAAKASVLTEDLQFGVLVHKSDLYFYNAATATARRLTTTEKAAEELVELSPDGSHAAFVLDNNLWVVNCETSQLKQLTTDGSEEKLNGILDWVYQEELYGRGNFKAFWWSPAGDEIALLKLDQAKVDRYRVSDSISFKQQLEETRYPKAGDPIPVVSLWKVNIQSGDLAEIDLTEFPTDDRLVSRVTWAEDRSLWVQVHNRVQNNQTLLRVLPGETQCSAVLKEESEGWLEIRSVPHFLDDQRFLWLSDLPAGRTHLFSVDVATGEKTALTSGEWDVGAIAGVSPDKKTVFVTGNYTSAIEQHLVAVDATNGTAKRVTQLDGSHSVKLDASCSYFIDRFSNTTTPPRLALFSKTGDSVRTIDAPRSDRHRAVNYQPPIQTTIPAADGLPLQATIMLPPGVTPENAAEELPVLFYVYGGPQAPTVKNEWGGRYFWWHQMLCQRGFAVVLCDNRSARGRGVKDTWTIRGDMGRVEMQDLEATVSWVSKQPWADKDRFGIWGWSYGGYFTAYAMTHSKLFRAGISGAPVTDWRNYDAIYTERYMDLPQDNEDGYESSSVVRSAANLSGRMMIIHGERDDNVHISNSFQLANALQQAGKIFDMMVYPKNRHGIVQPSQKHHLQKTMTEFLETHLK
ncbi:MAG: hypothetical protein Aurels2KO_09700 [Aureliella sp.]